MEPPVVFVLVVPAMVVVGVAIAMTAVIDSTVSRQRVERFARRHGLIVTATNGHGVIRYLAMTRRWRAAGMCAAVGGSALFHLPELMIGADVLTLFVGWFVGALVAEARLARFSVRRQRAGPRRAHDSDDRDETPGTPPSVDGARRLASLIPRRANAYLPSLLRSATPLALTVSVAIGAVTTVAAATGRDVPVVRTGLWTIAALVVAGVAAAVQRQVLDRPQPVAARDLVIADDAIRSRSLHVIAASGLALVLYCLASQLWTIIASRAGAQPADVALLMAFVVIPVICWPLAVSAWTVARPVPFGAGGSAGFAGPGSPGAPDPAST